MPDLYAPGSLACANCGKPANATVLVGKANERAVCDDCMAKAADWKPSTNVDLSRMRQPSPTYLAQMEMLDESAREHARWAWAMAEVARVRREDAINAVGDREYEVWSEGYAATGESAGAMLMGRIRAPSFRAACDAVMRTPEHERYYDSENLSYWGCRLFDNAADARQVFG